MGTKGIDLKTVNRMRSQAGWAPVSAVSSSPKPPVPAAATPKKARPDLEQAWLDAWRLLGYPEPVTQHEFHPERKWRFDFAWPGSMVAVEVHGGIFKGGRHTRGVGFAKDREKVFTAQEMGWLVYEVTNVKDVQLMDRIASNVAGRAAKGA